MRDRLGLWADLIQIGQGVGLIFFAIGGASAYLLQLPAPLVAFAAIAAAGLGIIITSAILSLGKSRAVPSAGGSPFITIPPPPASSQTAPVPPLAPDPSLKKPLTLSPSELVRLYRQGATELQSEALVTQHIGRWRTVSVVIEKVERMINIVISVTGKDADGTLLNLWFRLDMADRLSGFMPGDKITALGQVHAVTGGQVIFNDCDLA